MRDRTLPMKWVAEMAEAGKTDEEIRQEFVRREIKESTITDQLRKLQKHNIGGRKLVDHAKNDVVVQTGKPFRPVPKDGKKKEVNLRNFVVIGQAPAQHGDPAAPLEGKIGRKLATMLGWTYEDYLARTQRFNLIPEWPGRDAGRKGDRFPVLIAKENARRMSYSFGSCTVLFLGMQTGWAFGMDGEPVTWNVMRSPQGQPYRAAVLPHPSGINRWWNDDANKAKAARFMRAIGKELEAV